MSGRRCFAEGCEAHAPFGVRFPGPLSAVPAKYRGYLWHCEAHADEALARRDAALARAKEDGLVRPVQEDLMMWGMTHAG